MEQHSGSFLYHFYVVFLGGGILIPLLFTRLRGLKEAFVKFGFPLTYALSFIVVFGLSATKLPHYSWPVWPALSLFIGMRTPELSERTLGSKEQRQKLIWKWISLLPVTVLGLFATTLALFPDFLISLSKSKSFLGVFKYFHGFDRVETSLFLMAALLCFSFVGLSSRFLRRVEVCAVFSLAITLALTVGISRTLNELMVKPFYQIAETLKNEKPAVYDCIWYSGSLSPTLSLALAPELMHNRCEPYYMKYLVAPEWKAQECEEHHFKVIDQKSYLVLCKKG